MLEIPTTAPAQPPTIKLQCCLSDWKRQPTKEVDTVESFGFQFNFVIRGGNFIGVGDSAQRTAEVQLHDSPLFDRHLSFATKIGDLPVLERFPIEKCFPFFLCR